MPTSYRHSEAVEGGDFPRGNLLITDAYFGERFYERADQSGKKSPDGSPVMVRTNGDDGKPLPPFFALTLILRNDEGQEFNQRYSLGQADRYEASEDGATFDGRFREGCNLDHLIIAMNNAGFPDTKITSNCKQDFVGMYANWDTKTIGARSLRRGQQGRDTDIVVPMEIYQFPASTGIKAKRGAPTAPIISANGSEPTESTEMPDPGLNMETLVTLAMSMLREDAGDTRADLSQYVFASDMDQGTKLELIRLVDKAELVDALAATGVTMDVERFVQS